MKARVGVLAALAYLAAALPAHADTSAVSMVDFAYVAPRVVVLTGDTVGWRNGSFLNRHTVTSGTFDSGPIVPGGGFFHDFTAPGIYLYACTIHPAMTGEVDVYGLLLQPPARAVARGAATPLTGRAAASVRVITIEQDTGAGFHPVASAQAQAGSFRAVVRPQATTTYRAVAGPDSSPPVQVEVTNRTDFALRPSRRSLRIHVDPLNPGAKLSLQFKLRERFGWWTVARARLDRRSDARFAVPRNRRVWARIVLTQSDGWTPLAMSGSVRVGNRRYRER